MSHTDAVVWGLFILGAIGIAAITWVVLLVVFAIIDVCSRPFRRLWVRRFQEDP